MVSLFRRFIAIGLLAATAGCVTVVAAPGANQVRLTRSPADVAGCTAVGNVKLGETDMGNLGSNAIVNFRNFVVGFSGNTGLVTQGTTTVPLEGIAYRCPSGGSTAGEK